MSKWNLTVFYKDDESWNKDFDEFKKMAPSYENYKGKLHNYESFLDYHKFDEKLTKMLFKLYAYASLSSDLNLKDQEKMNRKQQLSLVLANMSQLTSYVSPEIISIGEKKVFEFLNKDDFLKPYTFPYQKLFRGEEHVLDNKSEALLSNFQTIRGIPSSLYQSLSIIDRVDEVVTLSDSNKVTVTQANFSSLIKDAKNEEDRHIIFEALYKKYRDNKNAFANTYNLVLQQLLANVKSRNYEDVLDSALFNNNIPTSVFINLMDAAYENTAPVKRYINLRKKHLNLKDYHTYDRFISLVSNNKKYSYDESRKLFIDSLKDMPKEFIETQKDAILDGYVDVNPNDGKRTGAYSSGMFGHHPFILLNHNETLDSVFTLAHEAGHSAHTIFSNSNQPMPISNYTIFVAEIASTFNEHLLLDHLLSVAKTKDERVELLESAINGILATFYRQTLFATYEYKANELVKNNVPITEQSLSKIMIDLYKHYYDIDITKEPGKQYVWAYIPHLFYTPFYVYQYATSFSASLKIYENIKTKKEEAYENYVSMLKSGGSKFPVDQAKLAGADLTNKETFMAVVNRLNNLIDLLENELSLD